MPKTFLKKTWLNEILSGAERYNIKEDDGSSYKSSMRIELATSVAQAGDSIDEDNLNRLENGIDVIDTKLADAQDLIVTGGTSSAYTIATIGSAALTTGEAFRIKFHVTAGATPTLNRDSKGAKPLKYYDSSGTKQTVTSSQIATNQVWQVLYDGTDYVLLGGSSGSGGGLSISTASVTTSNVTGVEGTLHNLNVSGMTAHRDFNLPTPTASGKRIGVRLSAGNDTYTLLLKINTVEWSRIFITNETVFFVSTGTGAGDWMVEQDGRIPCLAVFERITTTANTTHSASTDTKADWNSLPMNIGDCAEIINDRFTVRRAGIYECSGGYAPATSITDQKYVNVKVLKNGSTKITNASQRQSAVTSSSIVGVSIIPKPTSLAVGDYLEYYFSTEEANKGLLNTDYSSAGSDQLSGVTFFSVKEVLR